jgi:hypothetical protein
MNKLSKPSYFSAYKSLPKTILSIHEKIEPTNYTQLLAIALSTIDQSPIKEFSNLVYIYIYILCSLVMF